MISCDKPVISCEWKMSKCGKNSYSWIYSVDTDKKINKSDKVWSQGKTLLAINQTNELKWQTWEK